MRLRVKSGAATSPPPSIFGPGHTGFFKLEKAGLRIVRIEELQLSIKVAITDIAVTTSVDDMKDL